MARERVSKGLRFDIFKRDGFTCQYCGRQPPEVVLHVDHILPVIEGGDNDPMNLVTACQGCNLGKGRKLLDKPKRPDADLAWLEMQQELVELRAYQTIKKERDRIRDELIEDLQHTWMNHSGLEWYPSSWVLIQMLNKYSPEPIEETIVIVSKKVADGYLSKKGWLRYAWGTLRNLAGED